VKRIGVYYLDLCNSIFTLETNWMFANRSQWFFWALACLPLAAQTPNVFSRDICVKVNAGKQGDFAAFLPDAAKMHQVRVNDGRLLRWMALGAVIPMGSSARCDYHIIFSYSGFPSELPTAQEMSADLERAHLKMTADQMIARRDSSATVVSQDIWERIDAVGEVPKKGSYLRINYYKPKPGKFQDWVKLETGGWKPFAELVAKQIPGTGWLVAGLVMPGGDRLHYGGMTVDVFPSWESLGKDVPVELWPKAHPDLSAADFIAKVDQARDVYSNDVVRVVEIASK
jgi:hypothetical protein